MTAAMLFTIVGAFRAPHRPVFLVCADRRGRRSVGAPVAKASWFGGGGRRGGHGAVQIVHAPFATTSVLTVSAIFVAKRSALSSPLAR